MSSLPLPSLNSLLLWEVCDDIFMQQNHCNCVLINLILKLFMYLLAYTVIMEPFVTSTIVSYGNMTTSEEH